MSEIQFTPGMLVKHIHFTPFEFFVVKILEDGKIGCRYRSFHNGSDKNGNFQLHYAEFEKFELLELKPITQDALGIFFA